MENHANEKKNRIVVTGLGVMSSVGFESTRALSSLRAGLSRFKEISEYEPAVIDPSSQFPESLIGSPIVVIDEASVGIDRLLKIGESSLSESICDSGLSNEDFASTSLLVSTAEAIEGISTDRTDIVFLPRLISRVTQHTFQYSQLLKEGSAGFQIALNKGIELIESGQSKYCIIGGIDSLLDIERLDFLSTANRIKHDSNPDGLIPGEASAFVVIESMESAIKRGAKIYSEIGVSISLKEKNSIYSDIAPTGELLAQGISFVLEDMKRNNVSPSAILCDLNGESYWAKEWSYALPKVFNSENKLAPTNLHITDLIGDVGAANGAVLFSLASFLLSNNFVDWQGCILWCSSDMGNRAVTSILRFN